MRSLVVRNCLLYDNEKDNGNTFIVKALQRKLVHHTSARLTQMKNNKSREVPRDYNFDKGAEVVTYVPMFM